MKSAEALTELFRARGLKATPQRQCIFRTLHAMQGTHPSAEAVFDSVRHELPMVSLKTVYQTLNDLVAMGELRHLEMGAGPARFDVNLETHQHLSCEWCGTTWDVYADLSALTMPEEAAGFSVTTTDVVFRGRCAACTHTSSDESSPETNHHAG